jgi:hypothetical protein
MRNFNTSDKSALWNDYREKQIRTEQMQKRMRELETQGFGGMCQVNESWIIKQSEQELIKAES